MENREDILDALTEFGKSPNQQEIPIVLEHYLNCVAKNGETMFPWTQLKPLIVGKMEKVIQELKQGLDSESIPSRPNVENVRFDVMHARIIDALHRFNGAPFTIQRLCELLTDPKRHYNRSDKFMRGLEKNVLVVSTVDPFGRKVVCESSSKHMVNGMDVNGTFPPRDTALTIPLPPVPGWVTTASSTATTSRTTTPPSDSVTDQRLVSQVSTQNAGVVSNGIVSSGLSSTVYTDQGEQLAVQREEVIEETVVTMETNDVSSVAADAGEALAEGDEDEDMADDRTSSSSSSSSSSEELSTSSDSIDSNIQGSAPVAVASSSVEPGLSEHPWAGIALDEEESGRAQGSESPVSCQSENEENSTKSSPCSPPTSTTTSTSPYDAGPSLITPESTSVCVKQPDIESIASLPESSQIGSPQIRQNISFETLFSKSEDTSLPTDSISTSVPDSLQEVDNSSSMDLSQSDSVTAHQSLTSSLNPDSQVLSSSSGSHTDSDEVKISPCDHLVETESFNGSAEPAVSSSSSICTSSSTVPISVSNLESSLEGMPDSAQSAAAFSDNDVDSEPPRKCLKLSDESSAEQDHSFTTETDSAEASMPPKTEEPMDHVHSSADDLTSSPKDTDVLSHLENETSEGGEKQDSEVQYSSESLDSVNTDKCVEDLLPTCSEESKVADDIRDTVSSTHPDNLSEAREESNEV